MNWLGWSTRAMIGALVGAILGGFAYAWLLARGWDAPYVVGALAGLAAFVLSPDKSGLRGLIVMTLALWTGAIAQGFAGPFRGVGVLAFHHTLTPARVALYLVSAAVAFALARTSIRRGAGKRAAGA
ncbi:MAG: hypothetical protein JNL38_23675 [Myxococcales bacterium]|jgi:hypothetical protein|nr:hypothetical protein [Myxococcales bacterium]